MMRPKIVAGNWKMNGSQAFVQDYVQRLKNCWDDKQLQGCEGLQTIIIPPALLIQSVTTAIDLAELDQSVQMAAQNVAAYSVGAYTGEVSAEMLKDARCDWSLVGHSERRSLFAETDAVIVEKIKQLFSQGIRPILCMGETLEEREKGLAEQCVEKQLLAVLSEFSEQQLAQLVLAYEPVWAIGTGKTATPEEAQAMHKFIRSVVSQKSVALAEEMVVLYGGSVNSSNASSLFEQQDIDGALVGGASLKPEEFAEICIQCHKSRVL